jgi:hypothetical protein
MASKTVRVVMAVVAALCLPLLAAAQTPSMKDAQAADLQTMKDKFVALAGAFDQSQYDWRPMDGVRSVRDVFALIYAETRNVPTSWGYAAPQGAGFGPDTQAVGSMTKQQVIQAVGTSFDSMIGIVQGMDDAKRMSQTTMFGRQMRVDVAVFTAAADMHEHLGQLIAYARTNHVVPPWSK